MFVAPGLEGFLENEIAIGMEGNHNILVARPSPDRESTCVIRVEFAERIDSDEYFVGSFACSICRDVREFDWWGFGFGGLDVLALLGKVSHNGFTVVHLSMIDLQMCQSCQL